VLSRAASSSYTKASKVPEISADDVPQSTKPSAKPANDGSVIHAA
jgi:hypothetical protein